MNLIVRNIDELDNEIARLSDLKGEQQIALGVRFSSPSAIIATAMSLFPKSPVVDGVKNSSMFNQDFLGLISRFVLPLALNKTLFKHSNFLVKALVGIISQKASHYINEDNVSGVWGKITSLFNKKKEAKPEPVVVVVDRKVKTED